MLPAGSTKYRVKRCLMVRVPLAFWTFKPSSQDALLQTTHLVKTNLILKQVMQRRYGADYGRDVDDEVHVIGLDKDALNEPLEIEVREKVHDILQVVHNLVVDWQVAGVHLRTKQEHRTTKPQTELVSIAAEKKTGANAK